MESKEHLIPRINHQRKRFEIIGPEEEVIVAFLQDGPASLELIQTIIDPKRRTYGSGDSVSEKINALSQAKIIEYDTAKESYKICRAYRTYLRSGKEQARQTPRQVEEHAPTEQPPTKDEQVGSDAITYLKRQRASAEEIYRGASISNHLIGISDLRRVLKTLESLGRVRKRTKLWEVADTKE